MINSDFHTHTTFCDGKLTPDAMVQAAISRNMAAIGFSGHSHTPFDESYCMSRENTENYIETVSRLRVQYAGQIEVYLGLERDFYSDIKDLSPFDYVISSVHYVYKNGEYLAVDESEAVLKKNVAEKYGSDYFAFFEDYYKTVIDAAQFDGADIMGHFDLVMKFNEEDRLFDTGNRRYISAVNEALYMLAAKDKIIEINTGAMFRGYREVPYPMADILVKWNKLGGRIMLSSDAHDAYGLCYKFAQAQKLAQRCGFKEAVVFSHGKEAAVPL